MDVGVVKPVQTGEGDAETLRRWAELSEEPSEIAAFTFGTPVAPLVAARLEGAAGQDRVGPGHGRAADHAAG